MNVYGYCRVSTDRQADPLKSLAQQKAQIVAYCEAKGLPRPHVLSDAGESGGTALADRLSGGTLVSSAAPEDHVVFPKLDRAWRDAQDCLSTVNEWARKGVNVHFIDMGLDLSTPYGKCFLTILAAFAEWERAMIRERVTQGVRAKIARDGRCGGRARYGDTPEEQRIKAVIHSLRRQGYTWPRIAEQLNLGAVKPRNAARWTPDTVRRAAR